MRGHPAAREPGRASAASDRPTGALRVGLIGYGAIGSVVADALGRGAVDGARVTAVLTRTPHRGGGAGDGDGGGVPGSPDDGSTGAAGRGGILPVVDRAELLSRADLVVEAAGHAALAEHGPHVLESGRDLLVVSTGALADESLFEQLRRRGPGRLVLSGGALGGLDLLRAAARDGGIDRVTLTTTKRASTLVQPWMDDRRRADLDGATGPVEVFRGSAAEAARRFPRSVNVGASLALAIGSWEPVQARVVADPGARYTSHLVEATGASGDYRFEIRNRPSPVNPATSAVVPLAVLRAVADLAGMTWRFA